jgi:putative ABC transport system permease protein
VIESFLQDVRHAVRVLAKSPGFTALVVLTLAVGIGANTALFSVVDGVLLRPLPFAEAERLVIVRETSRELPEVSVSYPNFQDWRRESRSFESLAVYGWRSQTVTGRGVPERIGGAIASAAFLEALGVRPLLGRNFLPEEDRPGAERVVLVSHGFWQRALGADPAALGPTLHLDDLPYTVVGVMPPGFDLPRTASVWVPIGLFEGQKQFRDRGVHPGSTPSGA